MSDNQLIQTLQKSEGVDLKEAVTRQVNDESLNVKTQAIAVAKIARKGHSEEEVKELPQPSGTAYHCDLYTAHIFTVLVPENQPQLSKFYKSSGHLYHICHIMDGLMVQNRQFNQHNKLWNPFISRYYFGVLDIIQSLRAMDKAKVLEYQDSLFLKEFLSKFNENSLVVPGPLITYYKSICVSQCQYDNYGSIVPIITKASKAYPRKANGSPNFGYKNYLIPNIPGIVMMINQIATPTRQQQLNRGDLHMPFNPMQSIPVAQAQGNASLGGVSYSSDYATLSAETKWYFTTPGMEYSNEAGPDELKTFSINAHKFGFPNIVASTTFTTWKDFLCLKRFEVFSQVLQTMSAYCRHFSGSGSLVHCPPEGVPAGQFVLTRNVPDALPERYGDESAIISGKFKATTSNYELCDPQALAAYTSKIHSIFTHDKESTHPLNGAGTAQGGRRINKGPVWANTQNIKLTCVDEGYLRYAQLVETKFYSARALSQFSP